MRSRDVVLLTLILLLLITTLTSHLYYPILTVVSSFSMEPTLELGDLLIIAPLPYGKGDVVLYRKGTYFVVHRVLSVRGEYVVTKGDANLFPDPVPPRRDDVVGKVVIVIPYLGYLSLLLQKFWTIATLLILVLVVLQLSTVLREKSTVVGGK